MTKAIGCLYVGIFLKEYCRTLFLSVSPLVSRLEKQIARAYQQFLACVAIWIPEWHIYDRNPQAYGRSRGTSPYVSFKKAPNSLE